MSRPLRYLIISYQYAPHIGPRVFRWQTIAEHWASQGHHVDVVCARYDGAPLYEELGGVCVHRIPTTASKAASNAPPGVVDAHAPERLAPAGNPRRRPRLKFPRVRRVAVRLGKRASKPVRHTIRHSIRMAKRRLTRLLMWPDPQGLWVLPATRAAADLVARQDYDVVISVSWRFSSHLVALRLHRAERRWAWLVDVGDPFAFNEIQPTHNVTLYRRFNYWIERRIFRLADAITVTTAPTRRRYRQLFPESASKIVVIPPLSEDISISADLAPTIPAAANTLRLAFVGSLRRHNRRPDQLLAVFARLLAMPNDRRLELHFLGDTRQCADSFEPYQALIGDRIILHDVVPRAEAYQATLDADVLVNIGNQTDYQLPSKVVDYMSTGKPILNVATIEADSSASLLNDYPSALLVYVGSDGDLDRVTLDVHHFLHNLPPPLASETTAGIMKPFQKEAIVAAYEAVIEPALRRETHG